MATSEGIPSSIDIEFLELNDNPYNRSPKQGVIFVMRLASTPQYKAKIHKILFSSVDCVIQLGNCI